MSAQPLIASHTPNAPRAFGARRPLDERSASSHPATDGQYAPRKGWRQVIRRHLRPAALWLGLCPVAAPACTVTDWLTIALPQGELMETALELAYPGSDLDRPAGSFTTADGIPVPYRGDRDTAPSDRLLDATIGDMFVLAYPLDFDLAARRIPWNDPGRVRNDALFRAIWFGDRAAAQASLTRVSYARGGQRADFHVTTRHCVHAQLQAALTEIAAHGPAMDRYFDNVGGSFNWRVIAGTDRLSAHSFGIAVDFNSQLGGYWRWSGAAPGQAAEFHNQFPKELVQAMERYGFIWGGKWHHFDGMHFEYRPELILFARLTARH